LRRPVPAEDPDKVFLLEMTEEGPRFVLSSGEALSAARTYASPPALPAKVLAPSFEAPPRREEVATPQASSSHAALTLTRPRVDAPTQTETVLDRSGSERLPEAFWKAALPPSEVAAEYLVESGVERVNAPVAKPEHAHHILRQAEQAAKSARERADRSWLSRLFLRAQDVTISPRVMVGLAIFVLGACLTARLWPQPVADDLLVPAPPRPAVAAPAADYLVVEAEAGASRGGASADRPNGISSIDLETAREIARVESERSGRTFLVARRLGGGGMVTLDRVGPHDRGAWRDYMLTVWRLKRAALGWPRERYLTRGALDPGRTLSAMSDFIRSHPDSYLVKNALEDMRYVCYHRLQNPARFRDIALGLLSESLKAATQRADADVPAFVHVVKPYLEEAMNQLVYQEVHRFEGARGPR
jgi:hypothetical protein